MICAKRASQTDVQGGHKVTHQFYIVNIGAKTSKGAPHAFSPRLGSYKTG